MKQHTTRREQSKLVVYVDRDIKKKIKLIAIKKDTSIQEILETYVMNYLENEGNTHNEGY